MFAGIIESTAVVTEKTITEQGARLSLRFPFPADDIGLGASIALNGVCLTVVKIKSIADGECELGFEAINETLRVTNLGGLSMASRVNFERSVTPQTRIDGHFVSGHVDGIATVQEKRSEGFSTALVFSLHEDLIPFIAPKGSITVNGVALTVGEKISSSFAVYIIPHTAQVTNLGALQEGDQVNIEVDMLARYVVNYLKSVNPLQEGRHGN